MCLDFEKNIFLLLLFLMLVIVISAASVDIKWQIKRFKTGAFLYLHTHIFFTGAELPGQMISIAASTIAMAISMTEDESSSERSSQPSGDWILCKKIFEFSLKAWNYRELRKNFKRVPFLFIPSKIAHLYFMKVVYLFLTMLRQLLLSKSCL